MAIPVPAPTSIALASAESPAIIMMPQPPSTDVPYGAYAVSNRGHGAVATTRTPR